MKKAAFVILFILAFIAAPSVSTAQTCDPNNGNTGQSACNPRCTGDKVCNFVGSNWQCIDGATCTTNAQCASGRACVGGSCKYSCPNGGGGGTCTPACGAGTTCNNGVCVQDGGGGCGDILSSRCSTCPSSGYQFQNGNVQSCFVQGYSPNTAGSCLTNSQCGGNSCSLMTQGFCGCSGFRGGNPIQSCCQPANMTYFLSQTSANTLAGCLGGTVVSSQLNGPWRFMDPSTMVNYDTYLIKFRNGVSLLAGGLAERYKNNSKAVADQMTYDELVYGTGGYCGDNKCGSNETASNCAMDCSNVGGGGGGGATCGNNICEAGEASSCSSDCGNGGGGNGGGSSTSVYIQNVKNIINNLVNSYKAIIASINNGNAVPPTTIPPVVITNFPASITVNADKLNIRQAPNTQAALLGQFLKGDTFTAVGSVTGENVEGTDKWWKTSNDTYVWAGGTIEQ